jgi:hypothetical protein
MKIKRKVLGIFLCVIMLAAIPVASGMAVEQQPEDPETTDIGRTIIRGFYFNMRPNGFGYRFFALRIHYMEFTGTARTMGVVTMKPVTVGRQANIGFNYAGPVGFFGYMLGSTFKGGIDF